MIIDAFRPPTGPTGHAPAPPITGEVGLVRARRSVTAPPPTELLVRTPAVVEPAGASVAPARHGRPDDGRPMWRRVASALFTLAIVALAVFLWPARLGGGTRLVIVTGDSMEPTYAFGDLVVTRDQGTAEVGDIVVFEVPDGEAAGILVIHRVIDVDASGTYVTQGDNRTTPDGWNLTADDIVGRPLLPIPKGGYVVWYIQQWWVVAIVVGLLAIVLLWPSEQDEDDDEIGDDTDVLVGEAEANAPIEAEPTADVVAHPQPTTTDDVAAAEVRPRRDWSLADLVAWTEFSALTNGAAPAGPITGEVGIELATAVAARAGSDRDATDLVDDVVTTHADDDPASSDPASSDPAFSDPASNDPARVADRRPPARPVRRAVPPAATVIVETPTPRPATVTVYDEEQHGFFADDEYDVLLRALLRAEHTLPLARPFTWTSRQIDTAVMEDAVAWLDAQLERSAPSR